MTKEEKFQKAKEMIYEVIDFCNENDLELMTVLKPKDSDVFNKANTDCGAMMTDIFLGIGMGRYG